MKEEINLNLINKSKAYVGNKKLGMLIYNYGHEDVINKVIELSNVELRKKYYYEMAIFFPNCFKYLMNNDEEKKYVIESIMKTGDVILAYNVFKTMNNPKLIENNLVEKMLLNQNILSIYDDFKDAFEDALLKRDNYYELLEKKDSLSDELINKIYKKCINSFDEYNKVKYYLNDEEAKKLASIFISSKSDNVLIATDIIKSKNYDEKDYNRLLIIIGTFGTADVIYDVLMTQKLNESQNKMSEKALLDTHDIQYISYYYFYKNREMFLKLFGSTLLFLSFVSMNKELFTNTIILSAITELIKEENKKYQDETNSNIAMVYKRKGCDINE